MTESLYADDYRRLLAVVETAGRHCGSSGFRANILDALHEFFGYAGSAFFIAGPPSPPWRPVDGVVHGFSRLDEYATLWTEREPFAQPDALARIGHALPVSFEDVYRRSDPDHREYVDLWLRPQRIDGYMLLWLDTGLPVHGYLTLLADHAFGARDRALLMALKPHLEFYLRRTLPEPRAPAHLSAREMEVARIVAGGRSNQDAARSLGIREDTVKKHLSHAMAKLGLRNRTQLALALAPPPGDSTFVQ